MELKNENHVQSLQQKFDKSIDDCLKNNLTTEDAVSKVIKELLTEEKGNIVNLKFGELLPNQRNMINSKMAEIEKLLDEKNFASMKEIFGDIKSMCCNGVAISVLLMQDNFIDIIFRTLNENECDEDLRNLLLQVSHTLVKVNPWCLSKQRIDNIIPLFNLTYGTETIKLLSSLFIAYGTADAEHGKIICYSAILELTENILRNNELSEDILLNICEVLKIINQAQKSRTETLCQTYYVIYHVSNDIVDLLINHLQNCKTNKKLVKKILTTLALLTTRDSLCQRFLHCDGIRLISEILDGYHDEEIIMFYCCRLLQMLAQSDEVRNNIMFFISAQNIVSLLEKYHNSEKVSQMAIAFLVSLTMRHKDNSKALCENGIIEALKLCMSSHPNSKLHLKKSCWLVYNIASRNREYKDKFTNGGIVEMICKTHVQVNTCHFECKAALIQLGFKIEQVEKMIAEKKRANEMIQRNISLLLRDEN